MWNPGQNNPQLGLEEAVRVTSRLPAINPDKRCAFDKRGKHQREAVQLRRRIRICKYIQFVISRTYCILFVKKYSTFSQEIHVGFEFICKFLIQVRRLRTDLKHMIKYLVACKKGSLLVTTEMRSLSETPKIFSITDLENVKNGECEHICALAEKCHAHISQCQVSVSTFEPFSWSKIWWLWPVCVSVVQRKRVLVWNLRQRWNNLPVQFDVRGLWELQFLFPSCVFRVDEFGVSEVRSHQRAQEQGRVRERWRVR